MKTSSELIISVTMVVVARTFPWVTTTPLGLPVDPLHLKQVSAEAKVI